MASSCPVGMGLLMGYGTCQVPQPISRPEAYPRFEKWGTTFMASAEREPILGVWGLCPQWGPGAKPLVGDAKKWHVKIINIASNKQR
jgi:hypothetical protein